MIIYKKQKKVSTKKFFKPKGKQNVKSVQQNKVWSLKKSFDRKMVIVNIGI